MKKMPTSPSSYHYKLFTFFALLYTCIAIADILMVYRLTSIDGITITAGVFIMPIYYFLEDAIAEVYGYKRFRQLVWTALACGVIFALTIAAANSLPTPTSWHKKEAYDLVFGHLLRSVIGGGCISVLFGAFVNTYLITKWKILIQGKHFWLRSLGSSAIGQIVQIALGSFILYAGVYPVHEIASMLIPIYVLQVSISLIIVLPGALIVKMVKMAEGIEVYDYSTNFNPFKLSVGQEDIRKVT